MLKASSSTFFECDEALGKDLEKYNTLDHGRGLVEFSSFCPHCHSFQEFSLEVFAIRFCGSCHADIFVNATDAFKESFHFNQCPHCSSAHLYRQKDFNRKLGISLMAIGIILSFFTYGISLLLVTVIDWWLYKKVGDVGCCYRCQSQFRLSPEVDALPSFDLELYDYYQNLRP
ncbi:MAG: hypothetical protein NT000_12335 [Proteobacteria bacterium]|nr:hypothetical protein [Pseudomonadota bacterium]